MTKEEVKSIVMHSIGEVIMSDIKNTIRNVVKGELQIALQKLWPDKEWNNELAMAISTERSLQLKFLDEVSITVLTGDELNGKGGAAIRLVVVDKMTGQLVASGPEASPKVEILILEANHDEDELNWSFEDFDKRIIRERNKGKPYFSKDMYVYLERGTGILCNVKLGHGSTWVKDCWCRLGARVVDNFSGSMVKEAWTQSFMVQDRRIEYDKKKETPSLSDKIWRLRNIWKGGKIDQRLDGENIYTVEDLLIRLLKDYDGLKKIVNLPGKKWEDMVKHARACPSGRRMYCYTNSQRNTSVVFNIHGEILGLYVKGENAAAPMSSQKNKRIAGDLFSSAIGHWDEVFEFDDESSLQQHLSLQGIISNEASTQEKDMECIEPPFSIDDVPIIHDLDLGLVPFSNLDPDSNAIFENSMNANAGTEGTGFMLTEPEPLGKMNRDKSLTFDHTSTSTSSYFPFSPDFMQPMYSMYDSVSSPFWNDDLLFSEVCC